MKGCPRRLGHCCKLAWHAGAVFGVHPVGPFNQRRRGHVRIDPAMHQRGMHLKADRTYIMANSALMAGHHLHHRGLADNRRLGLWQHLEHPLDHRRRTDTAGLFVVTQRQLQRSRHTGMLCLDQHPYRQSVKALHVATTAPVILAIPFDHGERVTGRRGPSAGTTSV